MADVVQTLEQHHHLQKYNPNPNPNHNPNPCMMFS